jgi:hypothetical protein
MDPLGIPAGVGNSVDLDDIIFYCVIDRYGYRLAIFLWVNAEVYFVDACVNY